MVDTCTDKRSLDRAETSNRTWKQFLRSSACFQSVTTKAIATQLSGSIHHGYAANGAFRRSKDSLSAIMINRLNCLVSDISIGALFQPTIAQNSFHDSGDSPSNPMRLALRNA